MRISKPIALTITAAALLCACYSNNCPVESNVTCNYSFYDRQGNPVTYKDTINVTTLLPGKKLVYIYRQLGQRTITSDRQREDLIEAGYNETTDIVRRDTLLVNKLVNATSMKLPMSYFHKSDTVILSYSSISRKDTLYISHDSFSNVELPECGTHRFHYLHDIRTTDAAIDHVEIANPNVNYDGNENVKIYFNSDGEI